MHVKRILVPLNLKDGDTAALRFIEYLSRKVLIHATLLHVVSLNIFAPERRVVNDLRHENKQRLMALASLFFVDHPLPRLCVRLGRPHEEILSVAQEEHTELIVMASPRASRPRWRLSPTTVERVVLSAPCPTLILPQGGRITPEDCRGAARREHARPDFGSAQNHAAAF